MKVIFEIPFQTLNKVEVNFTEKKLTWKAYIIIETLPIIKRVQIINPKEFVKAALDQKQKAFVVYVATFFIKPRKMHPDHKVQIATLIADKASITVPAEYLDFIDVFSKESAAILPKYIEIITHAINLKKDKQLLYCNVMVTRPIT